jgi:rhamnulokinase
MENLYVACDLGTEVGRVMLGTLFKDKLTLSEMRRFHNSPLQERKSLQWNIPQLYQETLDGLRAVGEEDVAVNSISCDSWAGDYMLFDRDGSFVAPTYHHADPRNGTGMTEIFRKIPWETVYEETGVQKGHLRTLVQFGAEKSRRLGHGSQFMPVADGFNCLLSGVPRAEMSLASATQLFNPVTKAWSDRLRHDLRLPAELFPTLVPAGTELGALRPAVAKETKLDDARVIASCSNELAAALVGLPVADGETWAFLRLGPRALAGAELAEPIINHVVRDLGFTNETGYGGSVLFYKNMVGLGMFDDCRRFWAQKDRDLENHVLMHLATSSEPFQSLINPEDPRFAEPGDMPLKIQTFCRETGQIVPRKPGAIIRCLLESLALQYRKTLQEIELFSGRRFTRLYLFDEAKNTLQNHFIATALGIPMVIAPTDATSIGNIIVQAMTLGHIESLQVAREIVRRSFKTETITTHAAAWDAAYSRFVQFAHL